MKLFTLLPLEKFNLDELKPEESKKEDEEKRCFCLIPCTFSNWLQAFAILVSVIEEKHLENCSAFFCYLDSISAAHRFMEGWHGFVMTNNFVNVRPFDLLFAGITKT